VYLNAIFGYISELIISIVIDQRCYKIMKNNFTKYGYANWGSREGCTCDFVIEVFKLVFFGFTLLNDAENPCGLFFLSMTKVSAVGLFFPYSFEVVVNLGS